MSKECADMYGAQPVHPEFVIKQDNFKIEILNHKGLAVVEIYKKSSIKCLLLSIPIKEVFKDVNIKYVKMEVKDDSILKEYDVKELPALILFKNGKLLGKLEGYCDVTKKDEFKEKVDKIIKKA